MTLQDYLKRNRGTALAKAMGITPVLITQWSRGIRTIPAERVLQIVAATEGAVTPHDLRPDIYPDPHWMPPAGKAA